MLNVIEGKSGHICRETGVYSCKVHPSVKEDFDEGEEFTLCLGDDQTEEDSHLTTWILIRQ